MKISRKDEYMMGGKQLPPIPVALSLLTTYLSGILMIGFPGEIFERGMLYFFFFLCSFIYLVLLLRNYKNLSQLVYSFFHFNHTIYILLHIWGWLDSFCLEDSNSHLGPQIWLNSIMGGIASILTAMFFLPIFYKMHATCLHEYFEHRLSLFRLQMQLIQFIEFTFSLF